MAWKLLLLVMYYWKDMEGMMDGEKIKEELTYTTHSVNESITSLNIMLKGRISNSNIFSFQHEIEKIIAGKYNTLVFNMEEVSYVSPEGVGAFIKFSEKVKQHGGYVILQNLQPIVSDIFTLPGFDKYFFVENSPSVGN